MGDLAPKSYKSKRIWDMALERRFLFHYTDVRAARAIFATRTVKVGWRHPRRPGFYVCEYAPGAVTPTELRSLVLDGAPEWQRRTYAVVVIEVLPPLSFAAPRRLDRGNVDLLHAHHSIERALCFTATGGQCLRQYARRDLPGDAPLVFAPPARALLAAIADDGVPIAVGLLLIVGGDLEREGFVVLERRTAVEAETGDAGDREFDRQHVALLAGRVVTGCTVDGTHRTVGKGLGVEAGSSLGILVVP